MAPKSVPNGSVDAPIEVSTIPPVVGINFGNSFASIAVFTKEGLAECIANEDGERQIACAISFHGEEIYIGNQAKHQLVKNSQNTIVGFRDLLGKKFSEIPKNVATTSAHIIQHPSQPDEPAYKVEVLQAAPSPIPLNTPSHTPLATPRSEPISTHRILTPQEVTSMFLASLLQSASDFLGKKITGAVISIPASFSETQKAALEAAAKEAGINVLQLIEDAGAVAATTTALPSTLPADRTQLIIDLGSSSLALSLLSIRDGLASVLASSSSSSIGADQIDDKLIEFFAKEFTKKTKTPLSTAPPAGDHHEKHHASNSRALAKLRLALEHTKRTLSASPGAATCSVESLKDGMDFTGSINRMRFDMIAKPVYTAVAEATKKLLADAGLDAYQVDEIVYVGGTTCLPGLDEHLALALGFDEDKLSTPFSAGTIGGVGDPTTILARGCAQQAALISSISADDEELSNAFNRDSKWAQAKVVAKTLGMLFPGESKDGLGGTWVPAIFKETPLPARRIVSFEVALTEQSKKFAFEVWEATEGIRVEKIKHAPLPADDDDEEEEEEEEEIKHHTTTKDALVGVIVAEAKSAVKSKHGWTTNVEATFIVGVDGSLEVSVKEVGADEALATISLPAP